MGMTNKEQQKFWELFFLLRKARANPSVAWNLGIKYYNAALQAESVALTKFLGFRKLIDTKHGSESVENLLAAFEFSKPCSEERTQDFKKHVETLKSLQRVVKTTRKLCQTKDGHKAYLKALREELKAQKTFAVFRENLIDIYGIARAQELWSSVSF